MKYTYELSDDNHWRLYVHTTEKLWMSMMIPLEDALKVAELLQRQYAKHAGNDTKVLA